MAVLFTSPTQQFFDDDGNPLAAGKLYTYEAGTTDPKDTYTTQAGDVAHANPIILDAAGRAEIWLDGSYDFVLKDSDDAEVYSTKKKKHQRHRFHLKAKSICQTNMCHHYLLA